MTASRATTQEVALLVGQIYKDSVREFGYPPNTDMSQENKCHTMTKDLWRYLQGSNLDARRELHMTPTGLWHYVVAHSDATTPPSPEDVITDLNPWNFDGGKGFTGHLHAPRSRVMEMLESAGAPEQYIALRAISTIILPHTEELLTAHTHPPLSLP